MLYIYTVAFLPESQSFNRSSLLSRNKYFPILIKID